MQVFVLYAFNGKVMVPVARVLIANEDVKFFKKNKVLSKSPANWMVEWVVKRIKKECLVFYALFLMKGGSFLWI
jgi:hypothetical protein